MGAHLGLHLKNERKTKFRQLRVKIEFFLQKFEEIRYKSSIIDAFEQKICINHNPMHQYTYSYICTHLHNRQIIWWAMQSVHQLTNQECDRSIENEINKALLFDCCLDVSMPNTGNKNTACEQNNNTWPLHDGHSSSNVLWAPIKKCTKSSCKTAFEVRKHNEVNDFLTRDRV